MSPPQSSSCYSLAMSYPFSGSLHGSLTGFPSLLPLSHATSQHTAVTEALILSGRFYLFHPSKLCWSSHFQKRKNFPGLLDHISPPVRLLFSFHSSVLRTAYWRLLTQLYLYSCFCDYFVRVCHTHCIMNVQKDRDCLVFVTVVSLIPSTLSCTLLWLSKMNI